MFNTQEAKTKRELKVQSCYAKIDSVTFLGWASYFGKNVLGFSSHAEIKDEASGVPPANESSFRKARDSQRATSSVKGGLKKEICSSA